MGRKKKKPVKPWCWYCNREFDDDKILVQHQRAKHFKCPFCHKKLYSGPGLTVHCIQVHKETLDKIPEALPNRNSVDIDIYGMQGIPEEDLREHERQKRGDDGSKSQSQDNNQKPKAQPVAVSQPPMSAMHAAMLQHALGTGSMPPGFPLPPGMPPTGFMPPVSMPVGFIPPPGFPNTGMPMHMIPGMPPPPMGFPPGMIPPPNLTSHMGQNAGFPMPPPMGPIPSTSGAMLPPPPMSGVGHLLNMPPPQYPPPPPMLATSDQKKPSQVSDRESYNNSPDNSKQSKPSIKSQPESSTANQNKVIYSSKSDVRSSASTISKPATTWPSGEPSSNDSNSKFEDFILVPGTQSRIMHPNKDLSLEEIRIGLRKYQNLVGKLSRPEVS